ncbi:MAG: YiiX/YebB-like N1pC/P60 family cysteine hydrolase [Chitinophagaceae bacterium]
MPFRAFVLASLFFLASCKESHKEQADGETPARLSESKRQLQVLKTTAIDGDLVVRLNDDFVSEQLRFFNESDKSFSHAGIIVTRNGEKTVCSILPGITGSNPLVYAPIDSFLNPATNTWCGLFRYDLTNTEKTAFISDLLALSSKQIYFDSTINIQTDDSLYCSEMIYKSLRRATANRIDFKLSTIPKKMQSTVVRFYKGRLSPEAIAGRRVIFIDNLYRIPECRELMRFRLKFFPGT